MREESKYGVCREYPDIMEGGPVALDSIPLMQILNDLTPSASQRKSLILKRILDVACLYPSIPILLGPFKRNFRFSNQLT